LPDKDALEFVAEQGKHNQLGAESFAKRSEQLGKRFPQATLDLQAPDQVSEQAAILGFAPVARGKKREHGARTVQADCQAKLGERSGLPTGGKGPGAHEHAGSEQADEYEAVPEAPFAGCGAHDEQVKKPEGSGRRGKEQKAGGCRHIRRNWNAQSARASAQLNCKNDERSSEIARKIDNDRGSGLWPVE